MSRTPKPTTPTSRPTPAAPPNHHDEPDAGEPEETIAIFIGEGTRTTSERPDSPAILHSRLEWCLLRWAWGAGYQDWPEGVRRLARTLRGLVDADLIERGRVVDADGRVRHTVVVTDDGHELLRLLAITEDEDEVAR